VFTRSDITPPKVNRFGWNLENSEYIVWQILGAMRALARAIAEEQAIFSGRHKQRTILMISRWPNLTKFEHNASIGEAMNIECFRNRILKIFPFGRFFPKDAKIWFFSNVLRLQAAITPQWLQIDINSLPKYPSDGMSSFHFYRWNQSKVIPLACTLRTRNVPKNFLWRRPRLHAMAHNNDGLSDGRDLRH